MIIETIQKDHRNLGKLLEALERQLKIYAAGGHPDSDILHGVVDYCLDYPNQHHHPLEDLLFETLCRRVGAEALGFDLLAEHEKLAAETGHFAEAVNGMLEGAEMPRENFNLAARTFLEAYRNHMHLEEEKFLPLVLQSFTDEDWAVVEKKAVKRDDPLFGDGSKERFAALCQDILEWDKETLADS